MGTTNCLAWEHLAREQQIVLRGNDEPPCIGMTYNLLGEQRILRVQDADLLSNKGSCCTRATSVAYDAKQRVHLENEMQNICVANRNEIIKEESSLCQKCHGDCAGI